MEDIFAYVALAILGYINRNNDTCIMILSGFFQFFLEVLI